MPLRIPKRLQPRLSERFPNVRTRKNLDRAMKDWINNEKTSRKGQATRDLEYSLRKARERLKVLNAQKPEARAREGQARARADQISNEPTHIIDEPIRGLGRDISVRARFEGQHLKADARLLRRMNIERQKRLLEQSIKSAEFLLGKKK